MTEKILGEYCSIEVYRDGSWKTILCARSISLVTTTEFIDTTVTGGGKNKHFTPTVNSFTGNIEGITTLTDDSAYLTLYNLRQLQNGHEMLRVRYLRTEKSNTLAYNTACDCFISSITDTMSFDNVATFSVDIIGTGVPDETIINPPATDSTLMRKEFTTTDGQTSVTFADLIGKYIVLVDIGGTGYSKIKTTGTPASREIIYTSASGKFDWATSQDAGTECYIIYRDI